MNEVLKVGAAIVFFEDAAGLRRTMDSICQHVDKMFCIDGAYVNYPSKHGLSEDGSREVVLEYPNAMLIDMPFYNEIEKRNRYTELCERNSCNVLFIIDSDEYVHPKYADWNRFYEDMEYKILKRDGGHYNIYGVMEHSFGGTEDQFLNYPRIWYKPWEMKYTSKHWLFTKKPEYENKNPHDQSTTFAVDTIEGIKLWHDHNLRTEKHQEGRAVYQSWLIYNE